VICGTVDQPLRCAELEWLRDQIAQALGGPRNLGSPNAGSPNRS
jgi:hypothetical protein